MHLIALVAAVALSQSPDFVDAEARAGSGEQVALAAGGWLYRWSSAGELQLVGGAGGAASSLTRCDPTTVVVAGRRGLLRVVGGAAGEPGEAGAADLWDVASEGCSDVVAVGDDGLWQLDVRTGTAKKTSGVAGPLYGVDVRNGRATAVGVKGAVLHRVAGRRDEDMATWNGGRTWTRFDKGGWLAAAPVTKALFFLYGRDGAIERFDARPPAQSSVPAPRVIRAPSEEPAAKNAVKVQAVSPEPSRKRNLVPAKVATSPAPDACRKPIGMEGLRGSGFVDIRRVGDAFILAGVDGTVRRYRAGKMETVATTGVPMLGVAVDRGGKQITVVGFGKLAHSLDGGRSWRVEDPPERATIFAAAYAGRTLFVFDDQGRGHRRTDSGKWSALTLPRRANFFSASFTDERRGFVVGACGTLLATRDGGRTWAALPTPDDMLQGVLAVGERLYVSSLKGVFESDDGGDTWSRALEAKSCIRFAQHEENVAIACGDLGQPLWVSVKGEAFEKVQLDRVVHLLLATAFDADGTLVAVGPSEVLVRAEGMKGSVAYDSEESRKGLAQASWLWNELRRQERERPAQVVQAPAP